MKKFPLIVENHPNDYNGYEFITLIKFNDESFINIVDNVSKKFIYGYVMDLCAPENFDEEKIINVAYEWFYTNGDRYPISLEFSKRGMTQEVAPLIRTFPIDYVTRVIGPLPKFEMDGPVKVRKRKRKKVSPGIEIIRKTIKY